MKRTKLFFLLSFVVIGAILRYSALDFGFPKYIHPDEGHIVKAVDDMWKGKKVEKYGRPDRTIHYFNIAVIKVLSFTGRGDLNKSQKYYLGRFISLLIGVCSIIVAFIIGEQFVNKCGVMFSFATAFSPLLVENSRYITPEIFNFFFTLLVILCSIFYVSKRKNIFLLLAIFCCALNTAAKYPAIFTSLIIALAVFLRFFNKKNIFKSLFKIINIWLFCGVIFLIFFLLLFPQLITDYEGVYNKILQNTGKIHKGVPIIGFLKQIRQYFYFFVVDGGLLYLIVGFSSFFIIVKSKEHKIFIFLLIGFVIQIFLSHLSKFYMVRYAVMMSITPLFFWSYACSYLAKKSFASKNLYIKIFCITIVSITSFFFISKSLVDTKLLTGTPTLLMLGEYIKTSDFNEKNTIFDKYTGSTKKVKALNATRLKRWKNQEFLIISERWYGRFFDKLHGERFIRERTFYTEIKKNAVKIIDFKPTSNNNVPVIIFSPTSHMEYPFNYFDIAYIYKRVLFLKKNWNKPVIFGPEIGIYRNPLFKRK